MDYKVIYEEKYIQPGILLYREDFKQFLKIIPSGEGTFSSFTFLASDDCMDNPEAHFRLLTYAITKESPLYFVFLKWKEYLSHTTLYSILPLEEGSNQMKIEQREDTLYVHFIKDVRHSRNLQANFMKLTLSGQEIHNFYTMLASLEEIEKDKDYILQKMLYLKPKNKDFK